MKAVRRKADNMIQYLFGDDLLVVLNKDGLHTKKFRATDIRPDTHEIIEAVAAPELYVGGALKYTSGKWSISNQTIYEAHVTEMAEQDHQRRLSEARIACQKRIYAVADLHAQMNIGAASGAGLLSTAQMDAWRAGLAWVAQMRAAWRPLADDTSKDINSDDSWPKCPQATIELAAAF